MFVQHSTRYKDVPSWGLSDSFWERIKPFIPKPKSRLRGRGKYRKHIGGRPSAEPRQVMAGILYVLRTGCQCNAVPREYGSGKTLHRYFQRWTRAGVFKKLWKSGHRVQAVTVMIISNGMMAAVAAHNTSVLRAQR